MSQHPNEVASSSLPAQLLHHVTRRRQRFYGVIAIALVLFAALTFIYGGLATGLDLTSYVPRPKAPLPPAHAGDHTGAGNVAQGADGENGDQKAPDPAPVTTITTSTQTDSEPQVAPTTTQEPSTKAGDNAHQPTETEAVKVAPGIPPKIWQIMLPKSDVKSKEDFIADPKVLSETPSWLALNLDYQYTLVGHKGGEEFVRKHFGHDPRILDAYLHMPNVGMKSDLLRYLLLSAEGGVYTDTDTVALRPIDEWIPPQFRDKAAVVVGIEFDRRDGPAWVDISHWVQFCQWTIAAAPGHPVFDKMIERVLYSLHQLELEHGMPFSELKKLGSFEVMNSTGPAAWTDVVWAQLQEFDSSLTDIRNLSYMDEPRLYGDVVVLPIDGFGMGQPHSESTNDGTIPPDALVRHLFSGSWRGDKKEKKKRRSQD
ncbi:glycosyltransferase family 32 protein [Thermothelomyces thermophilus ATCC 42464]|uniref:Glycosyltransferase family 32 protein n=1 Tax=Thermothelomyces thermophilus (strain ATCC 42464 / BCRC 31852 / DSM 1799) TaxID=573729 RepID=G2Q232_THET4|nr:glycosyltransferase family 32 protein [Thermothelomyces thermophilus ATCC 42464]AEO55065.1 glycosyltransferase family 32 protein [Thermothelomyces thermophilus ATCC 42464]